MTTVSICSAQFPYTWNSNILNAPGDYQLTLTGSSGCDSVAILHLNLIEFNVLIRDTLLNTCVGNNYSIGVSRQPGVNYEWHSSPPGFTSTASNPLIYTGSAGEVYYYLSATNISSGCNSAASVHVIIDSCVIFTPVVSIYPNPANHQVNIQLASNTALPAYLKIMNFNGALILSKALTSLTTTVVELGGYQAGNY